MALPSISINFCYSCMVDAILCYCIEMAWFSVVLVDDTVLMSTPWVFLAVFVGNLPIENSLF